MKGDIFMSQKEISQVEIFEKLTRKEIRQKQAAKILDLSVRQIKRKLQSYKLGGAKSLVHQSRGKTSNRRIDPKVVDAAMELIKEKYWDFGPTLAHEKLTEDYGFNLSREKLRQEMISLGLWKPKRRRKAHTYQLREPRACFGELLQLDGSPHAWFEARGARCNLGVAIDDACGKVAARFSELETTQDYFALVEAYFLKYGLPLAFYVDRHSIFKVNTPTNSSNRKKPNRDDPNEGLTQFGRACRELNIELICANTPQAKGRVERVNQTLQDRLVKEMRLNSISSIEEANKFLPRFLNRFNQRFAKQPRRSIDMHRQIPKDINLKKILSVQTKRTLSKNLTFQHNNTIFQIKTKRSAYALRRTQVTVCERYDGEITIYDHRNKVLNYTTIKRLPRTRVVDSKSLNQVVDAILMKQRKRSPWESSPAELEQPNQFYKSAKAV